MKNHVLSFSVPIWFVAVRQSVELNGNCAVASLCTGLQNMVLPFLHGRMAASSFRSWATMHSFPQPFQVIILRDITIASSHIVFTRQTSRYLIEESPLASCSLSHIHYISDLTGNQNFYHTVHKSLLRSVSWTRRPQFWPLHSVSRYILILILLDAPCSLKWFFFTFFSCNLLWTSYFSFVCCMTSVSYPFIWLPKSIWRTVHVTNIPILQ
jgi:hypothetical protein